MQAFCPSAGHGTRLLPLTLYRAKPLLPVLGVPVFYKVLDTLRSCGCRRVVANRHHLVEGFDSLLPRRPLGLDLVFSDEERLLDTGGGLARVMESHDLEDPFFYHNGDILLEADLAEAVKAHIQGDHLATLLVDRDKGHRNVPMGENRRILGFRENVPGAKQVSWCGVAVLSQRIRAFFPDRESFCILEPLLGAIQGGEKVVGVSLSAHDYWCDMGTLPLYFRVHLDATRGLFSMPRECGVSTRDGPLWTATGAAVSSDIRVRGYAAVGARSAVGSRAFLQESIVWDGCYVAPGIHLENCVVTDGARVERDCRNEILSQDGTARFSL